MIEDGLAHSPAAERNRAPIGEVIVRWLPSAARVLEIGAGTGQHAVWFQRLLPDAVWQTTDLSEHVESIRARLAAEAPSLPAPLRMDVSNEADWPDGPWDAVYTANTLHIMPWENTPALLKHSASRVWPGGLLIVYGPFRDGEHFDTDSNRSFDRQLRERDPAMGLRDVLKVRQLAEDNGWNAEAGIAMPANNRLLIFRKTGTPQ